MRNETLLRALQESMRKLNENGISGATKIAQLRDKAEQARLAIETTMMEQSEAAREHQRISAEATALRNHVSELVRLRAEPVLISTLEDELEDLTAVSSRPRAIEALRARVLTSSESLEAGKAELEASDDPQKANRPDDETARASGEGGACLISAIELAERKALYRCGSHWGCV